MVRKHAQRLIHYIETLEAQAEMIRPKAVATAMRWLETLIHGMDVSVVSVTPKSPPRTEPWVPTTPVQPEPYIQPYIQPIPTPPWEVPWEPHRPWPKRDDFYYWDDLMRITSMGNTDEIK